MDLSSNREVLKPSEKNYSLALGVRFRKSLPRTAFALNIESCLCELAFCCKLNSVQSCPKSLRVHCKPMGFVSVVCIGVLAAIPGLALWWNHEAFACTGSFESL